MKFSYNWLQDFFNEKLPSPERLSELLAMHSFEVESVEKRGGDWVLDIGILPNRAMDCFCHLGVAREIAAITNSKLKPQNSKPRLKSKNFRSSDFVKVEVQDQEDCPRYSARLITNVKVVASPKWMQERLRVCGLQPINNIVDIANYVMLEIGQPVHTFDFDKIETVQNQKSKNSTVPHSKNQNDISKFKKIIVRRAKRGEEIKVLGDKTYQLDESILVIADSKKLLAIAGIKGGENTGIDAETKNVIIEAANFNQRVIHQGSRKLKLKTDASLRFEHRIDPNLIDFAQERIAVLIQELAGGEIAQDMVDFYPKKVLPKKIKLDLNYVNKLLGSKIPVATMKNILKRLEFKITHQLINSSTHQLIIEVPTRRLDISLPEDLIEEIGRIYGYQNIPAAFPQVILIPPEKNEKLFWQKSITNLLKEAGFVEVYNYSFIGEKERTVFDWKKDEILALENPSSSSNSYLRPSLIPNLLKNIKANLKFLLESAAGIEEIRIFEIGKIFKRVQNPRSGFQTLEKQMLAGALTRKGVGEEGFYELKGVLEALLQGLGISNVWYDVHHPTPEESKVTMWHPGICAELKSDNEEIGFLGEIHPRLSANLGIGERTFVFDLDFEKLLTLASEEQIYQPISRYPATLRDLAVVVPRNTKVVEVLNKIETVGGRLVRDVDLFDTYCGEEIPEGKENLAFHIVYQAEDRTLTSQEVDRVHQKIIKALEEELEWEVRR